MDATMPQHDESENEFGKVIGKKHIGNKMIHHVGTLSHPFFLARFAGQVVLKKDLTVLLKGARPLPLVL
jgi:hypothetical protein